MFIAMNRFRIMPGEEETFEAIWKERDRHLTGVDGFVEFQLLRGPAADDHTLYASHTVWRSRADFESWTRSEAFRKAHANAGDHRKVYLGHPEFEGFEVVEGA
jgi:heme-degrading monooxygenase HmoA